MVGCVAGATVVAEGNVCGAGSGHTWLPHPWHPPRRSRPARRPGHSTDHVADLKALNRHLCGLVICPGSSLLLHLSVVTSGRRTANCFTSASGEVGQLQITILLERDLPASPERPRTTIWAVFASPSARRSSHHRPTGGRRRARPTCHPFPRLTTRRLVQANGATFLETRVSPRLLSARPARGQIIDAHFSALALTGAVIFQSAPDRSSTTGLAVRSGRS